MRGQFLTYQRPSSSAARFDGDDSVGRAVIGRGEIIDLPQFLDIVPISLAAEAMDDIVPACARIVLEIEQFDFYPLA
jgi:hypothetical protein